MKSIYELLAKVQRLDFTEELEDGSIRDGLWTLEYKLELCDDRYREANYMPTLLTATVMYLDEPVAAWTGESSAEVETFVDFFIKQRDGIRIGNYSTGSRGREMWEYLGKPSVDEDLFHEYFRESIMPMVIKNFEQDGETDMDARFHAYEVAINMFIDNKLIDAKDVLGWKYPPELNEDLPK